MEKQRGRRRSQQRASRKLVLGPWQRALLGTGDRLSALTSHAEAGNEGAKQDGCNDEMPGRMLDDTARSRARAPQRARRWFSPAGAAKTAQQMRRAVHRRLSTPDKKRTGRLASPSSAARLGSQSCADGPGYAFAGGGVLKWENGVNGRTSERRRALHQGHRAPSHGHRFTSRGLLFCPTPLRAPSRLPASCSLEQVVSPSVESIHPPSP